MFDATSLNRSMDWQLAVGRCGLRTTADAPNQYPRITAQSGPMEVRIETCGIEGEDTRIVVEAPMATDFASEMSLPRSTLQLSALLDEDTRRHLDGVKTAGRLEVSPDRIVAVLPRDGTVSAVLPSLLAIAKRLDPPEIPRGLVENVKRASDGAVRLQSLLFLLRELPGDPATAEALRAACSDRSPMIRLQAAGALGAEGRDTLLQLAYSLEKDSVSAEAVAMLDLELPFEHAQAILHRAWSTGRLQTALACMNALSRGGDDATGVLAEVLAGPNVKLAAAAARALAAIGSTAAEAALIQALRHEEPDVQFAAAIALGHIGSALAVLPLKEAAKRSRLDLDFRQAARQAIERIQSRLQGASPGQLSLSEGEAGQLSLAQDPAGRLSLPPREDPA